MGGKQGDEEPARATHVKGDKRRQGAQEPGESHPHEDPERATHMKGDRGGRHSADKESKNLARLNNVSAFLKPFTVLLFGQETDLASKPLYQCAFGCGKTHTFHKTGPFRNLRSPPPVIYQGKMLICHEISYTSQHFQHLLSAFDVLNRRQIPTFRLSEVSNKQRTCV